MYDIFNPEIPGLKPPNPGISGLRKMPEIPAFRDSRCRDWNPYLRAYSGFGENVDFCVNAEDMVPYVMNANINR
jgi:hypothetical protein